MQDALARSGEDMQNDGGSGFADGITTQMSRSAIMRCEVKDLQP
jgi:hypothetical protein